MYSLPTFYDNVEVPLPKNMYNLPSYYETKIESMGSSKSLQSLEKRQDDMLLELHRLKATVEKMAISLGVSLPSYRVKTTPSTQDLVISASPSDPPLIICTLQHIMKQRGLLHSTASYTHSSVEGCIPEHVRTCFHNFSCSPKEKGRAPVILTILWKKEQHLPYLVVSPCSHTALFGEITIARYLCRTFLPDLYGDLTPEASAVADNWIDQSLEGSKVVKNLEAKLGKQQWIVGSAMSLADVVLASCIVKKGGGKALSDNLNKWFERIPGLPPR